MSRNTGHGETVLHLSSAWVRRRRASLWPVLWLLALAAELTFGGAILALVGRHGPALLAVLGNLLVALRFAVTLRPGSLPLISRYAQYDPAGLPPEAARYTRKLTVFWALFLASFALLHGGAMLDLWATATLSWVQAVLCPAVFVLEHGLRSHLLPELGRATPWRTFRAIRAHAGGSHAG